MRQEKKSFGSFQNAKKTPSVASFQLLTLFSSHYISLSLTFHLPNQVILEKRGLLSAPASSRL